MAERILTLRGLNRATLARQMLLERASMTAPAAIEQLVGLQAQVPQPPYIGLWTRLRDFRRDELAKAIEDRSVVKATLMRATLHLFTARDYLLLRTTLQPALTHAVESITKWRERATFDTGKILSAARDFIAQSPRTFAEISAMLSELEPDTDISAMRYTVRTHLPLVQVPNGTMWSYPGNPAFTLAESWLGKPISKREILKTLVHRYLAAFGPATVADIQTWSGLPALKDSIEKLKPGLRILRDEQGRELLDLPDLPLPDDDTPAPERFLPEFDNLLLSHAKRTRVIADAYRKAVYLTGLRVHSTILVDGFVCGTWGIEKTRNAAALVIQPFEKLTKQNRAVLTEEAEQLVRFAEPGAKTYEVRFSG